MQGIPHLHKRLQNSEGLVPQILALKCPPHEDVLSYVKFISLCMHEFARVSRRVEDLQRVAQQLYPVYMQPVRDGTIDQDNGPALFAAFTAHFKEAVAKFTSGESTANIAKQQPGSR